MFPRDSSASNPKKMTFELFLDSFLKAAYHFFDNLLFRIHVFYNNNIDLSMCFKDINSRMIFP